eukprot:COSAG02_NODE_2576_length_8498_cov_4.245386_6_plen_369_part_00
MEDTKTGLPCRPWAYWVLNENINTFLPRAVETADAMRLLGNSTDRYIYMTQPWVLSFFMDCDTNSGMKEWRNAECGLGPEIIQCPNATTKAKLTAAIQRGDIFWHAFPHNAQPGTYEPSLFEASLAMGSRLSEQLNVSKPVCFSQRDETGMTRAILPALNKAGVKMISLGSGGSSGGHPVIPDLFVWRDPATKAEVLFVHDHGYGGGMHVLPNGHAIYCAWNTDNGGPQRPANVQSTFKSLRGKYPGAKVYSSTFEKFYAHADSQTLSKLPVVTQEIGDTVRYGRCFCKWLAAYPAQCCGSRSYLTSTSNASFLPIAVALRLSERPAQERHLQGDLPSARDVRGGWSMRSSRPDNAALRSPADEDPRT